MSLSVTLKYIKYGLTPLCLTLTEIGGFGHGYFHNPLAHLAQFYYTQIKNLRDMSPTMRLGSCHCWT